MNNFDAIETAYQNEQAAAQELRQRWGSPSPSTKPTIHKVCKCGAALRLWQIAPDDSITEITEAEAKTAWMPTWAASQQDLEQSIHRPLAILLKGPDERIEHDIHMASCNPTVDTLLHIGRCVKGAAE